MAPLSAARLALWLGPWAGARTPAAVSRTTEIVDEGRGVRAYVFRPRRSRPRGVYLVAPGLHFAGPDDPRLDRFCRVLAHAGFVVVAPFLPDFSSLVIAPTATRDLASALARAIRIADEERLAGPAVFSISFGSRPAIELCASEHGERVSALLLFGGFCDFDATVRFAIEGGPNVPHDPLNAPVVHLNLLDHHEGDLDRPALARALRAMVERTWGRAELKVGDARSVHAHAIAAELEGDTRALFLAACGLSPDAHRIFDAALARAKDAFAWVDPRPHLARVRAPVVVVHGRDDDVIPWTEAEKLAAALPSGHPCEVILTGLYGHTGAALPRPADVAREVRALVRVVTLLARAPRYGRSPGE